ncbi:alpha/beta hydrolase [Actinomycetospora sp. OC33-EN08]|uniref:Alpha/beta hydrolase n=1 Tax=Actinomycetospora aurantiaca TaxID=3129233 RepID=A0ABU8MIC6_9PSEU
MSPESVGPLTLATGITLRVARSGTRTPGTPTLVLAHGWSQDLRTWDRVVADLRRAGMTGEIVRYDHRGHGGSESGGEHASTIGRAADDLAVLLRDHVEGPLVVAGHSMGGMTLMALAERHPDLVRERVVGAGFVATASDDMADLTLAIPGRRGAFVAHGERAVMPWLASLGNRAPVNRADPEGSGVHARSVALAPVVRALVFGRHPRRADVLSVAEQTFAADPVAVLAFRASIGEHRRTSSLESMRGVPTVVLVGTRDRLCPIDHAKTIATALPAAELVVLPDAGHMITFERSVEVAAHLQGLVEAATVPTPAVAKEASLVQ